MKSLLQIKHEAMAMMDEAIASAKLASNKMKETYIQQISCENCGDTYTQEFKTGTPSVGYLRCENCGCNSARSVGMPNKESIRMKINNETL